MFIVATEFYNWAAITKASSDDEIVFEEATDDKSWVQIPVKPKQMQNLEINKRSQFCPLNILHSAL